MTTKQKPEHPDVVKNGDMLPGHTISTYQYKCKAKRRIPHTRGKEDPHKIHCGGTIFIDHGSSKIDVFYQVLLGALDTIRSNYVYEQKSEEL